MKSPLDQMDPSKSSAQVSLLSAIVFCIASSFFCFYLGSRSSHTSASNTTALHQVDLRRDDNDRTAKPKQQRQVRRDLNVPIQNGSNDPETRREIESRSTRDHIEKTAGAESVDYVPLFQQLGLDSSQIEIVVENLKQLHWGASRVNDSMIKLNEERTAYDNKMKDLLPPGRYQQYREFELQRMARGELAEMQSFFKERQLIIPPDQLEIVSEAIGSFNVVTTTSWHGAYDPMPRPLFGKDEILPFLQDQIRKGTESSSQAIEYLTPRLSESALSQARSYFDHRSERFQKSIAFISTPP